MPTKARLKFYARLAHYEADIELADIFVTAVKSGKFASSAHLFDGLNFRNHPRLANRIASQTNQNIAVGHLYNTICASFIKDIYEDFSAYISEILRCCAKKGLNAERLIGEHKFQIDANQLLALGSWDNVITFVSENLFRKLENERSTIKLIHAIDAKLALNLNVAARDAAMPYLDMRHILVHRDGIVDKEFCDKYPQLKLKVGNSLEVGYKMARNAQKCIVALLEDIDKRVVSLVDPSDLQKSGS